MRDRETINLELALADVATVEKSLDRARNYLLEQSLVDDAQSVPFTLHRDASGVRLLLRPIGDSTTRWISNPLALEQPEQLSAPQPLQPLAADKPLPPPLSLRDVLSMRDGLLALHVTTPEGRTLQYTGVRQFGAITPLWRPQPDGSLLHVATNTTYQPNLHTGYFESAQGARVQPGFKVDIGLDNYRRMLFDADFREPFVGIFLWTILFAALTVLFSTIIGLLLAVLLNWEALRYRTLYRTLLFLPYAVPGFISILVFKGLFNQNFGEINAILHAIIGIRPAWFADPTLAKIMILIVNTWLGYPYIMILCTGLLKAIPSDLYEASAVAGAGPWTNLRRITMPLILRPLTPLLVSAFAFNFNNFVLISLLTDGRPDFLNTKLPAGTNDILLSYTYRIAFTDAGANYGLAAAISTLIFVVVAALSIVNLRLSGANSPNTRR